jgi:hypothetical protein
LKWKTKENKTEKNKRKGERTHLGRNTLRGPAGIFPRSPLPQPRALLLPMTSGTHVVSISVALAGTLVTRAPYFTAKRDPMPLSSRRVRSGTVMWALLVRSIFTTDIADLPPWFSRDELDHCLAPSPSYPCEWVRERLGPVRACCDFRGHAGPASSTISLLSVDTGCHNRRSAAPAVQQLR